MAAFTNLGLSASQLGTKFLNSIFVIERGRYDELGGLMTATDLINLIVPILAVVLLNRYRTGWFGDAVSHLRLKFNKLHFGRVKILFEGLPGFTLPRKEL